MSLLDNLSEVEQAKPKSRLCIVARQLREANLSSDEVAKLNDLLWHDPTSKTLRVPTTHLARALRKSGIPVSDKSLERHRERDCSCTR